VRLLQGSPPVLGLLKHNPFPDAPPKYVRRARLRLSLHRSGHAPGHEVMVAARVERRIPAADFVARRGISGKVATGGMKIAIGSDHAGFQYKEKIRALLAELGHEVRDFGTYSEESCDYPVFIRPVAEAVARGEFERGIVSADQATARRSWPIASRVCAADFAGRGGGATEPDAQ